MVAATFSGMLIFFPLLNRDLDLTFCMFYRNCLYLCSPPRISQSSSDPTDICVGTMYVLQPFSSWMYIRQRHCLPDCDPCWYIQFHNTALPYLKLAIMVFTPLLEPEIFSYDRSGLIPTSSDRIGSLAVKRERYIYIRVFYLLPVVRCVYNWSSCYQT